MQYSFAVKMSIYYPPMDKILSRKLKQGEKRIDKQHRATEKETKEKHRKIF